MMLFVRSLLFHLSMWITLAIYIPIAVVLILPLSRNGRYQVLSLWPKYHTWLLKVLCRLEYQVQGREHLPKTAAIVLAKHQSTWETFAFNAIFPPQTWVLKRELLWVPF
ncbi:MAG: 1-acyl-sn-glycerol-3-phosphate acyltransferase, partial [Gammaproteobacteria bacterium]|nr:1-acyl-sn-glycerol-3-phosphate acyltransferase [Gammaproteobacteria bacterium]